MGIHRAGNISHGVSSVVREVHKMYHFATFEILNVEACVVLQVTHYLVIKRLGCEANNSPPSTAEFKNGGAISRLSRIF
jgi:hypothetical protein